MKYFEKLRDPRWQKRRLEVLQREAFTCQRCGSDENELHVHHLRYGKDPWDTDPEFLECLCINCHEAREALNRAFREIPTGDLAAALIALDGWIPKDEAKREGFIGIARRLFESLEAMKFKGTALRSWLKLPDR